MEIDGRFWLTKGKQNFLGAGRVKLLETIDVTGSINAAAKELKMSYKGAWERVNGMNALSEQPLIERATGGRGGGGTKLTLYARELIATFHRLDELHRQFIDRFSEAGSDPERLARILGRTFLTTSARNQIPAVLQSIDIHGLHATLTLHLSGQETIRSTISTKSVESMGLVVGCDLYAIIKSTDVMIFTTLPSSDATDNLLFGIIETIKHIEDNIEITLRSESGTLIVALGQYDTAQNFQVGMQAGALISSIHIIIGL
jgi:molybdate transport system regulatory protein